MISEFVPVLYTDDPNRVSSKIHCELCITCVWLNPKESNLCAYGGPYIGFEPNKEPNEMKVLLQNSITGLD